MASVPAQLGLKLDDFPSTGISDQGSVEKLLTPLLTFTNDTISALQALSPGGSLDEVKNVTVQTPGADPNMVLAAYKASSGQILSNGSSSVIDFDTKEVDTDSAVTTGLAWKFTVPAGKGGTYQVSAAAAFSGAAATATDCFLTLYKSGTEVRRFGRYSGTTGGSGILNFTGSTVIQLSAGDTIQAKMFQSSGATRATESNPACNWIEVTRLNTYGFTPAAFSCFPLQVTTSTKKITSVTVGKVYDQTSATLVAHELGTPHWVASPGGFTLLNLPGLLPGKKYEVTFRITGS